MVRPQPVTATDELLVELIDEVQGLRADVRALAPKPVEVKQALGGVELREPAGEKPAPRQDIPADEAELEPPPAEQKPARPVKKAAVKKAAPRRSTK